MSILQSSIKCDKCDYRSTMAVTTGKFFYVFDGDQYNVDRCHGWCYECQKFVAMEYLGKEKVIEAEILKAQDIMSFVETAGFWTKMKSEYKKQKRDYSYNQKRLKWLNERLANLKEKQRPPRCLVCGATNVQSIYVRDLDYNNPDIKEKLMEFKHPNCGGELWLIRSTIRGSIEFIPRLYDVEGNMLD